MTDGPGAASGDRTASGRQGDTDDRWSDRRDEIPDPVDDGIAVGVPPAPEETGVARPDDQPPGGTILTDAAGLAAERDEYLGALQRLQADFENYRKRVLRQQEEQSARAALDLVGKVLPVLDTLDLARAHLGGAVGAEASDEARALDQARSQLLDVLAKEGLERVDEAEVEFDPVVHDAVAHTPAAPPAADNPAGAPSKDDTAGAPSMGMVGSPPPEEPAITGQQSGGPGGPDSTAVTVDEVLRAGYRWRGQVLRPAMVRVRG